MKVTNKNGNITVELNSHEALILFDWLYNFNEKSSEKRNIDEVEEKILFDLEAVLEKEVSLIPNYKAALSLAKKNHNIV